MARRRKGLLGGSKGAPAGLPLPPMAGGATADDESAEEAPPESPPQAEPASTSDLDPSGTSEPEPASTAEPEPLRAESPPEQVQDPVAPEPVPEQKPPSSFRSSSRSNRRRSGLLSSERSSGRSFSPSPMVSPSREPDEPSSVEDLASEPEESAEELSGSQTSAEPIHSDPPLVHVQDPGPAEQGASPTQLRAPLDQPEESLVSFGEPSAVSEQGESPDRDTFPPGFDSSDGLTSGTPEPVRARQVTPQPPPHDSSASHMTGLDESSIEDDWFSDEEGDLPTEEAHAATLEDFSSMYRAPMNVPEPPPIPGILDRFTPAPARRTSDRVQGAAGAVERPGFIPKPPGGAAPPPVVAPSATTPTRGAAGADSQAGVVSRSARDEKGGPFWQDPMFLAIIGIAALFAVVVLAAAVLLLTMPFGRPPTPQAPADIAPAVPRVVRPAGTDPVPLPASEDTEDPGDEAEGTPDQEPTEEPATQEAAPAPSPAPAAAPPRPRRVVAPVADQPGTLRVRSTRTVLVYINGQPEGMAPIEVQRPPGTYTVHIVDKGKRKEQRVDLTAGATRTVDF